MCCSALAQSIVSREEADHIFTLDRVGWEKYVLQLAAPRGWKIEVKKLASGSRLLAQDRLRGIVISMQPFYDSDDEPPDMLVVGSHYPRGTYPEFDDERKRDLETEVAADLGSDYSTLVLFKQTDLMEGFDIILTRP